MKKKYENVFLLKMYRVLVTRDFFYKYPFKTSGNSGLCDSFYEIRKMSTGQKKKQMSWPTF